MDTNSKVQSLPSGDCSREDQQALLSRIGELAREYRGREGALIQVLHMAQGIYGYLPLEVQRVVADGLELPLAEVSGVVSVLFVLFHAAPREAHHPRVPGHGVLRARGQAHRGAAAGSCSRWGWGIPRRDGLFTLEVARCIGACGLAPAMSVDDTVYKRVNPRPSGAHSGPVRPRGGGRRRMTIITSPERLGEIKAAYERRQAAYERRVLVCGGAGCVSCHCQAVRDALVAAVEASWALAGA